MAPHDVIAGLARYGPKGRSNFFYNPTTGTLEIRADARAKIKKTLLRDARRLKLRLYLRYMFLYFGLLRLELAKFRVKCRRGVAQAACLIIGFFTNS